MSLPPQRVFRQVASRSEPLLPAVNAGKSYVAVPSFENAAVRREAVRIGDGLRAARGGVMASDVVRSTMEDAIARVSSIHTAASKALPLATRPGYSSVPKLPGVQPADVLTALPPPVGRALGACAGQRGAARNMQSAYLPPWVTQGTWDAVQRTAQQAAAVPQRRIRPGWRVQADLEGRDRIPFPDLASV
eukprot:TRINITY_DN113843_c0_g1_i1.p1 TRINITY_DN113843_c0_g1~~TRINITY_DN113843_c0_g1_i1.p1  ORF type:complete len:203 (-),score=24.10 TRINITY_DN113843_c0_g1_i1:89-658(-)